MAIAGLRSTTSLATPTGRRAESWRSLMLRLYPYGKQQAPLAALTAVMKSESTTDPVFHWFVKKSQAYRFRLAANLSGGDATGTSQTVTIDVTGDNPNAFGVKAGDVLMVEQTAELLYVSTTPTVNNQITALRGFENANSQAVTYNGDGINPWLVLVGSAYEEGSAAPDPIGYDPEERSNQTQILRDAYALTGSAMATTTRTGDEIRESKQDCWEAFQVKMERAFIFGKKRTTVRNNQPLRLTDGILNQLPVERKVSLAAYNGLISPDYFDALVATMFRYGSSEKIAWVGMSSMLAITQMVRKNTIVNVELAPSEKEYGMDVRRLRTAAGTLVLKVHPMFGQMMGGINGVNNVFYPSFDNAMLILDMANLRYRYLKGRDVQHQPNMQLPGVDGMLAGYLAEAGLELHHPETHLLLTGIRGGAKDE